MTDGNDLSYPFKKEKQKGIYTEITYNYGLTKREHFAAMAMQGLLANPSVTDGVAEMIQTGKYKLPDLPKYAFAEMAIQSADALIEQLNKQP